MVLSGELGDIRGKLLKGQFGAYRLKALLGEGGMSTVYEGWRELDASSPEEDSRETYAIKIVLPAVAREEGYRARFHREIAAYQQLKHPSIVQIYDWGEDLKEGILFIVMEKVAGRSLSDILEETPVISIGQSIEWAAQALEGLGYAHRRSIVHRDIKPSNIFITNRGRVKILDFGLARHLTAGTLTATDAAFGTPQYLPPEQMDASTVDCRADLYSLGVVLYEMVTGGLPFKGGTSMEIIMQHIRKKPSPPSEINSEISPALETAILRLLEKKPEDRYASAEEAAGALRGLSASSSIAAE
jgi:serine/threonine-protein kinase